MINYNKAIALSSSLAGLIMYWIAQTNAVLITGSWVQLQNSDLDTIQTGATFGLTTMFESLKLLGIVVLIGAWVWLVNKAFNTVGWMFGGGWK